MSRYSNINEKRIWLWGMGDLFNTYSSLLNPSLNLVGVCDSDISKQGNEVKVYDEVYIIKDPCEIKNDEAVMICILDVNIEKQIKAILDEKGIDYCHIYEAVDEYWVSKESNMNTLMSLDDKMVKFIDCVVNVDACNLKCDYCYIGQHSDYKHRIPRFHSAKYIRKALSKERMGGNVFINFCGTGETLLCKELFLIVKELVEEGHYIQIVTNATIDKMIDKYMDINLSHVFFKCSLHYLQLKKQNLLDNFATNIKFLHQAGASVSVELVPEDELVPYIDEIKEYSLKNFGALPHLTVPRDERCDDLRILTNYSDDEFDKIWSVFQSPMFDFKMANRKSQRYNNCMAGLWALQLDLETGEVKQCTGNRRIGNVYDLSKELELKAVGKGCMLPYCFNCHAYLTLGLIPEVDAPTYCEMRDRTTETGEHWINETMRKFFSQKLYDNN